MQQEAGTEGATAAAFAEKLTASNTAADPEAIRILAENSGAAADWLSSIGMDLSRVFNTFGHGPADGSAPGALIVEALTNEMDAQGVDYRTGNLATAILRDDEGAVTGVEVSTEEGDYTIAANAVILASAALRPTARWWPSTTPAGRA